MIYVQRQWLDQIYLVSGIPKHKSKYLITSDPLMCCGIRVSSDNDLLGFHFRVADYCLDDLIDGYQC